MNIYRPVKFQMMIFFIISTVFFTQLFAQEISSLEGKWGFTVEDRGTQKFVFNFFKNDNGDFNGYVQTYLNENNTGRINLKDIKYSHPDINFIANPDVNVRYKGKVDFVKKTITGKLIYNNGSSGECILKWMGELEKPVNEKKEYTYKKPEKLNDTIETGTLSEVGLNEPAIIDAVNKINSGHFGVLHSLLIFKDRKLVLEEYFNGFDRDDVHAMQSVTKSITSLLIGTAIDRSKIEGIGKKVMDFLPEYKSIADDKWNKITLKHLLTMSAGVGWTETEVNSLMGNYNNIETVLKRVPKIDPGTKFNYESPNMALLAGVIKKSTGIHANKFAEKYLFGPLGIKKFDWKNSRNDGQPDCSGSLFLRPRDMVKIGLLILNNGKYKNRQIVSEKWIKESTFRQIDVPNSILGGYGYLWWLVKRQYNGKEINGIIANGLGSQFIVIFPEYNLVVVTTGGNENNGKHEAPLNLVALNILAPIM